MARFRVSLSCVKVHYATIEVEAESADKVREAYYANHLDAQIGELTWIPDSGFEEQALESVEEA